MNSSVGRPRRPSQDSRGFAHNGWPMTAFADFTTLCVELVRTASRLGKRRLVAEFLRTLPADEVASAVAFMTGRPFPVSDSRVLNVRGLPAPARDMGPATGPPLTIADVEGWARDRKSTRLNSSHLGISYAVFCLKKKKKKDTNNGR